MDFSCLCDLTENVAKAGNELKKIPKETNSFLRQFNECIRRGFISWIKEIIKGKCLDTLGIIVMII